MRKNANIIPFENLSGVFNNIEYDYSWIFTNGYAYNLKGDLKFRDYLLRIIFSKNIVKKYCEGTLQKNTYRESFFADKDPIKESYF